MTFLLTVLTVVAWSEPSLTSKMLDKSMPASLRNDACFALRGNKSPEVVEADALALKDPKMRRCAEENLRLAGAIDAFKAVLEDENPELRAVGARVLGTFQKPELAPLIAKAGADSQLLVGTNAIEGLSYYTDRTAVPYFLELSKRTGIVGSLAFEQLIRLNAKEALVPARELIASNEPADLLAAMRVLGTMGDKTDIPLLEGVAKRFPDVANSKLPSRGFGFMPPISLFRAAESSIDQIRTRKID